MRSVGAAAVLFLSLAACHSRTGPSALAYKRPLDVLSVGLGLSGQPCFKEVEPSPGLSSSTKVFQFIGEDACYRFRQPEHFSGVWFDETEYSVFFEGARAPPQRHFIGGDTELIVTPKVRAETEADDGKRHAFRVEFTGRRTAFPGPYGDPYSLLFRNVVIVDRMERISELPTPGPFLIPGHHN